MINTYKTLFKKALVDFFFFGFVNVLSYPDKLSILDPKKELEIENVWSKFEVNRSYGCWIMVLCLIRDIQNKDLKKVRCKKSDLVVKIFLLPLFILLLIGVFMWFTSFLSYFLWHQLTPSRYNLGFTPTKNLQDTRDNPQDLKLLS